MIKINGMKNKMPDFYILKLYVMSVSFKAALTFVTALVILNNNVGAQDTLVIKSLPMFTITAATMHVPHKVWKSFAAYFPGAYNSRFFRINKDYIAKFILNSQENRVLFTQRGALVYGINYGYEKNLPEEILAQVKFSYIDYDITRAIRIAENDRIIWVVNLETQKRLIIVRIEDGDMEETKNLNKL